MKMKLPILSLAVILGCAVAAPTASAQSASAEMEFASGQARIGYSGKLRTLSQRIPSAACHLVNGIDPDTALNLISATKDEFALIIEALEFGNPDLSILGPEERRKTVAAIHDVRDAWQPMITAVDALIDDHQSQESFQTVLTQSMAVLDKAESLVADVSAEYANPTVLVGADAFLIDIAGRQRTLTQLISKDACVLSSGAGTPETTAALQSSVQIFTASLEALRFGMPSAGIRRPPTAEISEGLEGVLEEWATIAPLVDASLAGTDVPEADLVKRFHGLNTVMAKMNDVVTLYQVAVTR